MVDSLDFQGRPIFTAPAFVCNRCKHTYRFNEHEYKYLEAHYTTGCTCGGSFKFKCIRDQYKDAGISYCNALKDYKMTSDCPTPACVAHKVCGLAWRRCHIDLHEEEKRTAIPPKNALVVSDSRNALDEVDRIIKGVMNESRAG